MKPKFAFLLLMAATFSVVSCSEKDLYNEEDPKVYAPADFKMTESYDVNVTEGTIKEVYVDGELVFSGNGSLTIEVPKTAIATRSLEEYELVDADKGNSGWTYAYKRGLLLFEDVTNGDNDYNDFVCNIEEKLELKFNNDKTEFDNVKYNVTISPLAMGNTLRMKFGVELFINGIMVKNIDLSEDVRKDFFNDVDGYLNTVKGEAPLEGTKKELKDNKANGSYKAHSSVSTHYYIEVNGEKRYVCDSHKAVLTQNQVPYGLFIPSNRANGFRYAQELESFFEAYPHFMEWVDQTNAEPFKNPNADLLY